MAYEGHIENGMVVLAAPLPFPDGTPVRVEALAPASFWQPLSIDDLAKLQGASVPGSVEDLVGGWPEEDREDDFEAAFVRWRKQELEHRS